MLPAPQVLVTYPNDPIDDIAIAEITIPYTISQPLTVNYNLYTQTLTPGPYGGDSVTSTLSQAGGGSVTIPAGSDEADIDLPGTYNDPAQPVVTLIAVSLPGETLPDSAGVAFTNGLLPPYDMQAWPANYDGSQTVITATTPTTTYGGAPGVFELTRSGDLSEPLVITPDYNSVSDDYTMYSQNEVSGNLGGAMQSVFPAGRGHNRRGCHGNGREHI